MHAVKAEPRPASSGVRPEAEAAGHAYGFEGRRVVPAHLVPVRLVVAPPRRVGLGQVGFERGIERVEGLPPRARLRQEIQQHVRQEKPRHRHRAGVALRRGLVEPTTMAQSRARLGYLERLEGRG